MKHILLVFTLISLCNFVAYGSAPENWIGPNLFRQKLGGMIQPRNTSRYEAGVFLICTEKDSDFTKTLPVQCNSFYFAELTSDAKYLISKTGYSLDELARKMEEMRSSGEKRFKIDRFFTVIEKALPPKTPDQDYAMRFFESRLKVIRFDSENYQKIRDELME